MVRDLHLPTLPHPRCRKFVGKGSASALAATFTAVVADTETQDFAEAADGSGLVQFSGPGYRPVPIHPIICPSSRTDWKRL